ncbi:dihydrolipoyllysine-residue acetyltransferase [Ceraceosorus bombacis]|uniref:dihydrolipoyllysine-residue (2-methylpropanoyl)transferase n=1 Tax=Ceraceosorus bombacis TaxID=401625 RepID=A0A0P1BSI4_9BASI|nr:dihydrolipoyllysine-residue acetyltransferase [Ceraceosorus bombacis]
MLSPRLTRVGASLLSPDAHARSSVEITSRYAGRIIEQCYAVGQVARVGTPLCRIEVEDDTESAPAELSSERLEPTNASTAASESSISSNVTPSAQEIHPSAASFSPSSGKHAALATPAVRRICREEQVDVSDVTGTGKDGRVTKEDVMMYVATRSSAAESSPGIMPTDATHAMTNEQDTEVELNSIKRAMFRAMTASWNIPHFGYSEELDVTELERLRKSINASREQTATKLTMLPLLLKALSMALYDHALFRCMVPSQGASSSASAPSTLLQRATHDISIALSTPSGLLTPTLPDIRQLSVWDISQHVKRLQDKASSRESRGLSRADLRSDRPGSITLSNVGTVGGTAMSPLLPPTGQLAIGAIGKARLLPRYVDEAGLSGHVNASPIAQPRLILPTSWTADHRFVEGVELAKLVQDWKANVEHPHRWFLRLR